MNLESLINRNTWDAVVQSYSKKNFTSAIKDAFLYLSDLIREKSGLGTDGAQLVGDAFGGPSPKIRMNKLQTESDWNMQKGIEQILRGMYQAIRNPRNHGRTEDTKEEADSIILFIDYLIGIIGASKGVFSNSEYLQKVYDPDFAKNTQYARLLVEEIPLNRRFEIFVEAFRQKEGGETDKLQFFFTELYEQLTNEQKLEINNIISEELRTSTSEYCIAAIIDILPPDIWTHFKQIARLRIENKIIESIKSGEFGTNELDYSNGYLGIKGRRIFRYFTLKTELTDEILQKLLHFLPGGRQYVYNYLFDDIILLMYSPTQKAKTVFQSLLNRGDKELYRRLKYRENSWPKDWIDALRDNLKEFEEKHPEVLVDDDLPF